MKTKRLLSVLTLATLLPLCAAADVWQDPETKVNYEYTVGQSEASVTSSKDVTGDITILSSFTVDGNDYTVTSIGDWAFSNCISLTSVTIPSSVTSIGIRAFLKCTGLTSVTIQEGVASIGKQAFDGCSGLTSIIIPEGVTTIEENLFSNCSRLFDVIIPKSVTTIESYAFKNCIQLTSFTIPEGVTEFTSYAFDGCKNLAFLTINCEKIGYRWFDKVEESIKEIVLGDNVKTVDLYSYVIISAK